MVWNAGIDTTIYCAQFVKYLIFPTSCFNNVQYYSKKNPNQNQSNIIDKVFRALLVSVIAF